MIDEFLFMKKFEYDNTDDNHLRVWDAWNSDGIELRIVGTDEGWTDEAYLIWLQHLRSDGKWLLPPCDNSPIIRIKIRDGPRSGIRKDVPVSELNAAEARKRWISDLPYNMRNLYGVSNAHLEPPLFPRISPDEFMAAIGNAVEKLKVWSTIMTTLLPAVGEQLEEERKQKEAEEKWQEEHRRQSDLKSVLSQYTERKSHYDAIYDKPIKDITPCVSAVTKSGIVVNLIIDEEEVQSSIVKMKKDRDKQQKRFDNANKKISNEGFLKGAPSEIVAGVREEWERAYANLVSLDLNIGFLEAHRGAFYFDGLSQYGDVQFYGGEDALLEMDGGRVLEVY